jgi:hypothetical protein
MYSQTKSYVGIAIGLLQEEGKLSIKDRIYTYFPEKCHSEITGYLKDMTIEEMLTMTTVGGASWWFSEGADPDRTALYLNGAANNRPGGTYWEYDSAGSQVLSSLVEKLSGMSLLDYLRKKLFNKMGTFKNAEILKTKTDDSWGDSALLCTLEDMASFGRLLMQGGSYNGEQLINKDYVTKATSAVVCNDSMGFKRFFTNGYGYQIWRVEGGFAFNGMGCQLTICLPEKDLLFTIVSDNQGYDASKDLILAAFYDFIADPMGDELPEDKDSETELSLLSKTLKLCFVDGQYENEFSKTVSGKVYVCESNPMGIKKFSFTFNKENVIWKYENAQGEKEIEIGLGENIFQKFPQLGYSDEHGGTVTTDGFMYDSAISGAFREERKFVFKVQVIDRYFGNFFCTVSFKDNLCVLRMTKTAEDFFAEYEGVAIGKTE